MQRNLIPIVTKEASIFHKKPQVQLLYFYMLSDCEVYEDEIVSNYSIQDLRKYFPTFEDLIQNLVSAGIVKFERRRYLLGEEDLYTNTQTGFTKELAMLKPHFDALSLKRRTAETANSNWRILEDNYLRNTQNIKNGKSLSTIFSLVYYFVYGEDLRDYTGKEIGQFNHLFKFYGMDAVKMIVGYICNAPNPNIGSLLFKKDEFYHAYCGSGKTLSKQRKIQQEDDDESFK